MKKVILIIFLSAFAQPVPAQTPWEQVSSVLGKKGTVQGDMFKLTYPRTDLDVRIGNVPVDPRIGLTSWIGFRQDRQTTVMGDLVLKASEVQAVMKRLGAERIQITALHNHLMATSVPIMYLHFEGTGEAVKLAASLKAALSETGTPLTGSSRPPETMPAELSVIQYFLGPGKQQGSVLKYEYPRNGTIMENDLDIPGFLGTATSLNFSVFEGKIAATGDFVLTADEVNPVIKALTDANIAVTAVHNHMLHETPRLFFLHFWAYDTPETVGTGLRSGLDKANVARQSQ